MSNEFARNIQDANLNRSVLLPAAGATANMADWDFGTGAFKEGYPEIEISVPATPAHTAGVFTAKILHGAAASPTTSLASMALNVASSTAGGALTTGRFRIPSNTLQYVRVQVISSSGSDGDNTAVSATATLNF